MKNLKSPDWVRECPRRMMIGFHVPDNDQAPEYAALVKARKARPILSEFDARDWAGALKKAGVQAVYIYSKCHAGNAYYPSAVHGAHVHSVVHEKGDIFGQMCEACLSAGIVPMGVYEFSDGRIRHDHPHWCHRRILTKEEYQSHSRDPHFETLVVTDGEQGMLLQGACLNGPYGDYAVEQAREVVRDYPIEGYYIDFLGLFTFGQWVCPYCAPRFKADMGFDFKGLKTMTRRQRIEYGKWHYAQNAAYIDRMRRAIEDIRPGLVFVHNFHGGYAKTGMQTWEMARRFTSFATGDMFTMRGGPLQIDWKLRAYAAASRMRPAEALLDSAVAVGGQGHPAKALDSYRAELWTARALNVAPTVSNIMSISGRYDPAILALIEKVYSEQAKYEPWLKDMQPQYTVGILRSSQTLEHLDGQPVDDSAQTPHGGEFSGWCQALIRGHFLWDVVHDHLVTADYLKRFALLILPHAACLSRAQCAAVTAYLRDGGNVIATGETSCYTEDGEPRKNFGLSKALGVSLIRKCDRMLDQLVLTDRSLKPREKWVSHIMPYDRGQCRVRAARDARVKGEIYSSLSVAMVPTLIPMNAPGVVQRKHGRGTALYFAGHPGLHYFLHGVDIWRRLMTSAVGPWADKAAPVTLDAPDTVGLYAHHQNGRSRLVVNLVNWVSGCVRGSAPAAGARARFDETPRMPPSGDVVLRIRPPRGKTVRRVYLAPNRKRLRMHGKGRNAIVTVPSFDVHAMVVAEF